MLRNKHFSTNQIKIVFVVSAVDHQNCGRSAHVRPTTSKSAFIIQL